jgi:hypothetical protein
MVKSAFHQFGDGANVALEMAGNFPFSFPILARTIELRCLNRIHIPLCLAGIGGITENVKTLHFSVGLILTLASSIAKFLCSSGLGG